MVISGLSAAHYAPVHSQGHKNCVNFPFQWMKTGLKAHARGGLASSHLHSFNSPRLNTQRSDFRRAWSCGEKLRIQLLPLYCLHINSYIWKITLKVIATCIKSFIFSLTFCIVLLNRNLLRSLVIPVRNTFIPKSCACRETCHVPPSLKKLLYRHARSWEHPQEGGATCIYSPARRSWRGSEFRKV